MKKQILQKEYDWESLYDLERDIYEAIESGLPGEFKGTINVTIEYEEEQRIEYKSCWACGSTKPLDEKFLQGRYNALMCSNCGQHLGWKER